MTSREGMAALAAVGVFLAGCSTSTKPAGNKDPSGVTYFHDVKPILEARCAECHTEGGMAPFSLETYADVVPWLGAIKTQVTSRSMPPWTAGPDCNEYVGDPSLSDAQIQAISDWVDAEGPKGDPADEGAPLDAPEGTQAFEANVELEMPEAYTPMVTPDEYRCFVLPWPETTTKYINGVGLRPGNKAMVHHAVLNLAEPEAVELYTQKDAEDPGPGYTCFTAMATALNVQARASLIGAFEKPEPGQLFPNGTGMRVKPGSAIILQVHYNTLALGSAETDRSTVEFSTVDEVEKPVRSRFATDIRWALLPETMQIPAGDPDAWVSAEMSPAAVAGQAEFDLYWADLHMHTLGTKGELSVLRADGTKECLLRIDEWRFEWQQTFFLKQPTRIHEGDKLYLECHWGNTPERQYRVNDEPLLVQDVAWGDGSRDEMCLGNFLVTEPPPPPPPAPPPDAGPPRDAGADSAPAEAGTSPRADAGRD